MSYALEIDNLKKIYSGGTEALKGISLKVNEGDFYALLGPNGAGKSSTIGIIGTLVTKSSGNVKIFGIDLDENVAQAKSMLGVVSQEINFSQFEKVLDIVTTQAGFYGIKKSIAQPKVEKMLKRLGLWDKRHDQARTLSGGFKRRLMIAKALIHEPKLLILDEPTAGVDIELRRSLWEFLKEINDKGTTIILTTHYLEEAEKLCKNISIIDQGKIVKESSMKSLLSELESEIYIFETKEKISRDVDFEKLKITLLDENSFSVQVHKSIGVNEILKEFQSKNIEINSIHNETNRLEELFLKLTRQE